MGLIPWTDAPFGVYHALPRHVAAVPSRTGLACVAAGRRQMFKADTNLSFDALDSRHLLPTSFKAD